MKIDKSEEDNQEKQDGDIIIDENFDKKSGSLWQPLLDDSISPERFASLEVKK